MVRTDIFRRGVPWMLLIKRTGTIETDLNVKLGQKACVAFTGLALAGRCSALLSLRGRGLFAGCGLAAIVVLNRGFFAFLVPAQGIGFRRRCPSPPAGLLLLLRALGRDRRVVTGCCDRRADDALPKTSKPAPIRRGLDSAVRRGRGWARRLASWRVRSR